VSGGKLSIWVVNDHKYPVILKQGVSIASIEGIDQVYESPRDESYDSELNDSDFSHFNDFSNECHDADTHEQIIFTFVMPTLDILVMVLVLTVV